MRRLVASSLCLLAFAAVAPVALGQSAGDDQYADPFSGQDQSQGAPDSSQSGDGQAGAGAGTPAAPSTTPDRPGAQASETRSTSGSRGTLAYTGYPTGLVALLGLFALATGLMLMAVTRPQPASRRGTPPVLGRELRLAPRARR